MAILTKAAFLSKWNSLFADNATRDISEQDLRDFRQDISDSFLSISDNFIDEDSFASDSATKVPSQQSVKAYVDAATGGNLTVTKAISSAELLSCFTSPIELIPAPGAGKFIQVLDGYVYLIAGASAYSNETTQIQYGAASPQAISIQLTAFLNTLNDAMCIMSSPSLTTSSLAAATQFVNQNVEYAATAADPTTGDGTMVIGITYKIITV